MFLTLFPIAANSIRVLAPQAWVYTLMVIGMVTIFYLPFIVCKGLPTIHNIQNVARTGIGCIVLAISLFYCYQSNANYTEQFYVNKQAENFFSALYARVLSEPGYESGMEIVFAGNTFSEMPDRSMYDIGELRYGGNYIDVNMYSRHEFIRAYFGIDYRDITDEELKKYQKILEGMDCYPNYSSVKAVDEKMIIVKLEDLD